MLGAERARPRQTPLRARQRPPPQARCFRRGGPSLRFHHCAPHADDSAPSHGQWRSGVLEQSWRIGGCRGAEVAALQAFKTDGLRVVRASTHEIYDDITPPPGATELFNGSDAAVGRLVKYVQVQR